VGAGEGLFALIDMPENTVVAFYNGLCLTHESVNARDWMLNGNTISIDELGVIDVPPQYGLSVYKASLAHKSNHCFQNNAKYDWYDHPRFGLIKCIRTIKPVKKDEEITVLYDYNELDENGVLEAPAWYLDLLKKKKWMSRNN